MKCPKCGHKIPDKTVAAAMGSMGGKVKGPSKARSSEQARAAVMARWAKAKKARSLKNGRGKKTEE
jgi:hypothetical protein